MYNIDADNAKIAIHFNQNAIGEEGTCVYTCKLFKRGDEFFLYFVFLALFTNIDKSAIEIHDKNRDKNHVTVSHPLLIHFRMYFRFSL